jgi:uncharacterized protein YkwD
MGSTGAANGAANGAVRRGPRHALLAIVVLLAALLIGAQQAGAASPTLSVSPSTGAPGTTLSVSGSGFPRFARVTLRWDGESDGMPTTRVRNDGTFRLNARIPGHAAPGSHTLQAAAGDVQASSAVVVPGAPVATATTAPTATRTPTASAPSPTRTAVATATRTAVATATRTAVPSDAPRSRLLALVNGARADAGLPPVVANAKLEQVAQSYAATMASTGCFSHSCPPEPDFVRRAEQGGYTPWRALGENIAYGQRTADDVFAAWMSSSGHRANILNGTFQHMGVGLATNGAGVPYWVQEFGALR